MLPGGYLEAGFLATTGLVLALPAEAPAEAAGLQVYPNPARGTATVRLPAASGASARGAARTIALLDALGRVTWQAKLPADQTEAALDLRGLVPGLYVVRVTGAADGRRLSRRLVVE